MLAEIAKEMPWSLNQPQNQKPTNPKVSKTTIKQQISKLNERLEKLGLPSDGKNLIPLTCLKIFKLSFSVDQSKRFNVVKRGCPCRA